MTHMTNQHRRAIIALLNGEKDTPGRATRSPTVDHLANFALNVLCLSGNRTALWHLIQSRNLIQKFVHPIQGNRIACQFRKAHHFRLNIAASTLS